MSKNVIVEKSYNFALKIIKLYKYLVKEKKEYILSKQILRSGTSIGANVEESQGTQSKKEFISKLYISYREARETNYWLRLLIGSGDLKRNDCETLVNESDELAKILFCIIKKVNQ